MPKLGRTISILLVLALLLLALQTTVLQYYDAKDFIHFRKTNRSKFQYSEITRQNLGTTNSSCLNTFIGSEIVADNTGRICNISQVSNGKSCCPVASSHFSCDTCSPSKKCCSTYEHCIACCMQPNNFHDPRSRPFKYRVTNKHGVSIHKMPASSSTKVEFMPSGTVFTSLRVLENEWVEVKRPHGFVYEGIERLTTFPFFRGSKLSNKCFDQDPYMSCSCRCLDNFDFVVEKPYCYGIESLPLEGEFVVKAGLNSCSETCTSHGFEACDRMFFYNINSCQLLYSYFKCTKCRFGRRGFSYPGYSNRTGACIIAQDKAYFSCDSMESGFIRLCPCVNQTSVA